MIRRFLRRWLGPVPRVPPIGGGAFCDGCDVPLTGRKWAHGRGFYCARCYEETWTADDPPVRVR